MNIQVYDNTFGQWVAEHGWTSQTMDAKAFATGTEAREYCHGRKDLHNHRISITKFESSEVIGLHQLFTKAARAAYVRKRICAT